jgi:hypothetical protein
MACKGQGSNLLSSTPGPRSCSASTAHESSASGSKSAAICLCEANSGRRHTVDSGQHRRGPRPVDRAPPGRHHQPGRARRRPDRPRIHSSRPGSLCVERWMAFVPDERRVVPHMGDSRKNGAHGANANRAEVPTYSAGRRAPSCVSQDGESLGTGGQAALPPHPGWPPTLPRCRDPGIGGDPVRAFRRPAAHLVFLGTLERLHPWLPPCEGEPGWSQDL